MYRSIDRLFGWLVDCLVDLFIYFKKVREKVQRNCSFAMPVYIYITRCPTTNYKPATVILYCFTRYLLTWLKMAVYNQNVASVWNIQCV
jgi:hypothetical protein